ncbi:hypothetical protein AVEN_263916-1 [Araneus ventricosus]|uniref:Uncharacterized protein n=1 Tax=Araneus ventricosus TaxID=182803 RepID=A0A4Y2NHP2_ARAVE|nr:hypothetical protein AVEN_263916-1 [Araneus ventricosus]
MSRFEAHEEYVGTNLVIFNRGQMTRTTPEPVPPSSSFLTIPEGRHFTPTDLMGTGLLTRWFFGGIGSRSWNSPAPKPRPYHQATAALI